MAMKSMELTPAEKQEAKAETAPEAYAPRYAGGLCLWLDDEALKRLDIKEPMKVGTVVNIQAIARVVGQGIDEHETGKGVHLDRRMSVQITDMELAAKGSQKTVASILYPDQD